MRNYRKLAWFTAAALAVCSVSGVTALADEKAFSIDMSADGDAWANVAIANDDTVESGVNIRAAAGEDAAIVGYLYRGGAVRVLYKDDQWSEIQSGNVRGYIKNEYLVFASEAKGLAEHYGVYGVRASWDDVNLFAENDAAASIVDKADSGDTFRLIGMSDDWAEVQAGADRTVFMPAEEVDTVIVLDSALSVDVQDDGSAAVFVTPAYDSVSAVTGSNAGFGAGTEGSGEEYVEPVRAEAGSEDTSYTDAYEDYSYDDGSYDDGSYDDGSYDDGSYDDGSYDDGSYDDGSYDDGSYDDGSYDDGSYDDGSYDDGSYDDGSYEDTSYNYDTSAVSGTLQEQANQLYQIYLQAQADADAAVANGSSESVVNSTAAAATAAYQAFLSAQNAADEAAWGGSTVSYDAASETDTSDSYTDESYDAYEEEEDTSDQQAEETPAQEETQAASQSTASSSDLELLAALIYCEAGNQPYEGQVAVGAVVMNRIASGSFPGTVKDVIYQGGQFTPAYSGALASALASGAGYGYMDAASAAMAGEDPTGGCLYFNTHQGSGVKIGAHWFF